MRLLCRLLPALLLVLAAAPLASQQVRGRVLDDGGQSVGAATVVLQDPGGRRVAATRTDDGGRFELRVPREGLYRLRAERIGYGEVTSEPVQVGGRLSVDLELRLSVQAVALAPLLITAQQERARLPRLERVGFYRRQEQGMGEFFERGDIDRQRPVQMSVLVSQVPGVLIASTGTFSPGDVVMMRGSPCLPSIWLDGRLARPGSRLENETARLTARLEPPPLSPRGFGSRRPAPTAFDDLVTPHEVEAVEVYRGPSEVPAIFAGSGGSCGAVVVWTQFHAGLAAGQR